MDFHHARKEADDLWEGSDPVHQNVRIAALHRAED